MYSRMNMSKKGQSCKRELRRVKTNSLCYAKDMFASTIE